MQLYANLLQNFLLIIRKQHKPFITSDIPGMALLISHISQRDTSLRLQVPFICKKINLQDLSYKYSSSTDKFNLNSDTVNSAPRKNMIPDAIYISTSEN